MDDDDLGSRFHRWLADRLTVWPGVGAGTREPMIIAGVVLLLLGLVLAIPILWTAGVIVLIVGLVLLILGRGGRRVGGRAHYW